MAAVRLGPTVQREAGKMTEPHSFEAELIALVKAWSVLPRGNYSPREIEDWMQVHMGPAVLAARAALREHGKSDDVETLVKDA